MTLSRRNFISGALASSALALNSKNLFADPRYGPVDTVILGGKFYTMDPFYKGVEALAIRNERIVAVGSLSDIKNLSQKHTKVIDAQGMTVVPGFIDAGIPVAPASDYTPGPYEPMMALESMVTRKDLDGNVWGPS